MALEDCLRLAETAPSIVTLASQESRIAALGVTAARAGFLPRAQILGGAIYNTPRGDQQRFIALNGSREYVTMGDIAFELDTSGRLRAAYARAKADQEIARTGVRIAQRDLRRAVSLSYYRLLLTRRLSEAAAASLEEAAAFEARTRKLFQGGEVAQADVVKAAAQTAFLKQAKRASDLDAELANQELASFWTASVSAPLALKDTLTELDPPPAAPAGTPYFARPEFRIFDLQKAGFRADARRERAALFPQLTLQFQHGIDAAKYSFSERGTALFAALNVPVFDWFRARSLSGQFQQRAAQAETARRISERTFSREYESALSRARQVYELIAITRDQVRFNEENLKLSQIRYAGGEGPALDVVVAQEQVQQARVNYFSAWFQYAAARIDLEVASGR